MEMKKIYRARSFFVLVLSGLALAVLPLLVVLGGSEVLMGRLVRHGSQSVYRAVSGSRLSQKLTELLLEQERRLRQYEVLGDRTILEDVKERHKLIQQTMAQLSNLPNDPEQRREIAFLTRKENELTRLITNSQADLKNSRVLAGFVELQRHGRRIMQASAEQTYQEVSSLQAEAARAKAILFWLAFSLIPLTGLLIAVFARLISRPIKQIDYAINQLGKGDFIHPIAVSGPDDLVFLGERLDWLRQNLAVFEKNKSKFAAHVSHELKTPLASIREGAELLADEIAGPVTSQQREIVDILRKNCTQLQALIENLLAYTMSEARNTTLNLISVHVDELVQEALAVHKPLIMKRGLQIKTAFAKFSIVADAARVTVIVDNLLSNALKYSPPDGEISLSLRLEDGGMFSFDIIDNGPGVAATEREEIFRPFTQGSTTCRSAIKGSGLGLAIAREYAVAHGGELQLLESENGAHFRLIMPVDQGERI
ncbi:ATP-binding protein [Desulfobacterota bacterium M19]